MKSASGPGRSRPGQSPGEPSSCDDGSLPGDLQLGLLPGEAAGDERLSRLARAIELEIIPRLMLAHRTSNLGTADLPCVDAVDASDVESFVHVVLNGHDEATLAHVQAMVSRGLPLEVLYLDLLAPAARRLGELWTQDLCDFTEVTLGLGRLQRVLRETSAGIGQLPADPSGGRRILLLPGPGEQHTFGLVMVAELFRRAGWEVAGGPWEVADDAAELVAAEWYDVVGFSIGSELHVDALAACIRSVRQASRNDMVGIMVGGPMLIAHPEWADHLGADMTTGDGRQAPQLAEQLVSRRAGQR